MESATKQVKNVAEWLKLTVLATKRGSNVAGWVGVWFGKQKGACFMVVLKIVDAYRYYYVIIPRIFYLCVIYCA